jgi:hypothetical protein
MGDASASFLRNFLDGNRCIGCHRHITAVVDARQVVNVA